MQTYDDADYGRVINRKHKQHLGQREYLIGIAN